MTCPSAHACMHISLHFSDVLKCNLQLSSESSGSALLPAPKAASSYYLSNYLSNLSSACLQTYCWRHHAMLHLPTTPSRTTFSHAHQLAVSSSHSKYVVTAKPLPTSRSRTSHASHCTSRLRPCATLRIQQIYTVYTHDHNSTDYSILCSEACCVAGWQNLKACLEMARGRGWLVCFECLKPESTPGSCSLKLQAMAM